MLWRKTLVASIISGLFLGTGGRIVMLVLALIALGSTGFSLGGTFEVIATGFLFGFPGGVVYAFLRNAIGKPALWKAACFGFLYFLILVMIPPPAAVSASSGLGQILPYTLILFGFLFVIYGVILELVWGLEIRG